MSMAAISGEARARLGAADVLAAAPESMQPAIRVAGAAIDRHVLLGERLGQLKTRTSVLSNDSVERKDLAKLYPQGYSLREQQGVLRGEAQVDGEVVALAGFIGGKSLGAERAWAQADVLWNMLSARANGADSSAAVRTATLHLLVDCDSHATTLDDERIMLSAYLTDLAMALHALAIAGTRIETTVLGKLGGGVYVALAAPVARVNMLYGTEIQLLPGRAIASILGDVAMQKHEFNEYQVARVADQELKLGIV
jgi:hypothetical protein